MELSRMKYPLVVVAAGFGLGLASDLLFYDQPLGVSLPIVILLAVLVIIALSLAEGSRITTANVWLVIPLLFFAAMSAVRAAPLPRFLNISGTLLLFLLLINRLSTKPMFELGVMDYALQMFESGLLTFLMAAPLIGRGFRIVRSREGSVGRPVRRVLFGVLIALPFLCIFTILFSSADLIFNQGVERILDALNLSDLVGHALLTGVLAWLFMGGLAYALSGSWVRGLTSLGLRASKPEQTEEATEVAEPPPPARPLLRGRLGALEASVVLFSVDALFLIFVAIQFAALFGGEAFLQSQGLTYSEYARRGFFELLWVALITLSLILGLDYLTSRETAGQRTTFLIGSGLLIVMAIIILGSAFERMQLYELAYGFTRLRVHPHVFMVWLAILLAVFLVMLLTDRTRYFATAALVAVIGFSATLDMLNPDAFIVRQNLARYARGEELDVAYLGSLSADAVPDLLPLMTNYGPEIRDQAGPWIRSHLLRMDGRHSRATWASYHVAFDTAYRLLDRNRSLIEPYDPIYSFGFD